MATAISKAMLKAGRSSGMLQKDLYVIFTRRIRSISMEEMRTIVAEHLKFQVDLEQRNILFGAGPLFPPGSEMWEGDGMVIIRAASLEEANEIAAQDPMHVSGKRDYVICPWMMNEGSMNIRISYSDGKAVVS